ESLVLWPVYGLHQFADRQARIVRDLVSIAAHLERELPGRVELLLLNDEKIGPVPGEVFNYLYANSAMPGVFEGQNTSSLVISLGRPFLQLRRESSGIEGPYPKKIGAREFADEAAAAETAALALRDGRPD